MKHYVVSLENLNKVLAYLAARPFNEVAHLVPLLQIPQIVELVAPVDNNEESK